MEGLVIENNFKIDTMLKIHLQSSQEKIVLQEQTSCFLFSSIFKVGQKQNPDFLHNQKITLEADSSSLLLQYVQNELIDLIQKCYSEPDEKHASRRRTSSRYEKFEFMDKKYKVDCTFSINGRMIYNVYSAFDFLSKSILSGNSIEVIIDSQVA